MRRRDFLCSMLALSGRPGGARRLLFFDSDAIAERSQVTLLPPPLQKLGPVLRPDTAADSAGVSAAMGCGITRLDNGRTRLYYSSYSKSEPQRGTAMAESDDGIRWERPRLGQVRIDGQDTNRIAIEGLPDGAHLTQPSLVRLSDGRWRIYGWLGRSKPRILRYIAVESTDGIRWKAVNVDEPCLLHPLELSPMGGWSWVDGPECERLWKESGGGDLALLEKVKRLRSNDATHTYLMPGGGFEMFSVWALPNRVGSGRRMEHDNARAMLRVIHRRTSEDGLIWSDPEMVLVPDEQDAWDQQFYYLAQYHIEGLRLGFAGRYRVIDQDMDIEFLWSRDGRRWKRPMRGPWLQRGPEGSFDSTMIYMPSHLIDRTDHWLALYSAVNMKHNRARLEGVKTLHAVKIPRYRFAGLSSEGGLSARIRTAPFVISSNRISLDASLQGSLRAELCDAFGRSFEGMTIADAAPLTGDSEKHELRWKTDVSAYRGDAASLRLEWTRGIVYGITA